MTMEWSLYTDLYQLTMAQGYLEAGKADEEATFNMYFRDYPFRGGYAIACGMAQLAEILGEYRFTEEDIAYLADIPAPGGGALFHQGFLEFQVIIGLLLLLPPPIAEERPQDQGKGHGKIQDQNDLLQHRSATFLIYSGVVPQQPPMIPAPASTSFSI